MNRRSLVAFFAMTALPCGTSSALAEQLTLDCDILESSHPAFQLVDQIVIDVEKRRVEFREAATMGTTYERNWIFTNRLEDRLDAIADADGIVAFGVNGGRPLAIRFGTDGVLTYVAVAGPAVWSYRWRCLK